MDQVRQRLCSRSALVEVRALATERVRRHHGLRSESILADRALQVDLLKRRHGASPTTCCVLLTPRKGKSVPSSVGDSRDFATNALPSSSAQVSALSTAILCRYEPSVRALLFHLSAATITSAVI